MSLNEGYWRDTIAGIQTKDVSERRKDVIEEYMKKKCNEYGVYYLLDSTRSTNPVH